MMFIAWMCAVLPLLSSGLSGCANAEACDAHWGCDAAFAAVCDLINEHEGMTEQTSLGQQKNDTKHKHKAQIDKSTSTGDIDPNPGLACGRCKSHSFKFSRLRDRRQREKGGSPACERETLVCIEKTAMRHKRGE